MSNVLADRLEDLADLIDRKGWCRGITQNDEGQVCAVGGIALLVFDDAYARDCEDMGKIHQAHQLVRALRDALLRDPDWESSGQMRDPILYNDWPGRTKEQVLDLIRGAAKYERMKEEGHV